MTDAAVFPRTETTYWNRAAKYFDLTCFVHLFHKKKTIEKCQQLLSTSTDTTSPRSLEELNRCRSIVSSCVNPSSGTIIPFYGRMAMFVPINIPICAGMILGPQTLPSIVFWQWINQSYNAIFNYSNAGSVHVSKTSGSVTSWIQDNSDLLKAYSSAVTVSISLAVVLTECLKRARLSPQVKKSLQAFVPYTAVSCAAITNLGLMRSHELTEGLPVRTPGGTVVGHSQVAAKRALVEASIARAVLCLPIFLLPAPLMAFALRYRVINASRFLKSITEITFVTLSVAVGLPCALAIFPQTAVMSVTELEEPLREPAKRLLLEEMGTRKDILPAQAMNVFFTKGV